MKFTKGVLLLEGEDHRKLVGGQSLDVPIGVVQIKFHAWFVEWLQEQKLVVKKQRVCRQSKVEYGGKMFGPGELAKKLGVNKNTMLSRLMRGRQIGLSDDDIVGQLVSNPPIPRVRKK